MRTTQRNIVLVCFLLLSAVIHAISFEVQVPITPNNPHSQQIMLMPHHLADGHFQTIVQTVDENGHAYAPGQSYSPAVSSGPRRVGIGGGGDLPPDPFIGEVVPVGNTPWILIALLLVGYGAYRKKRAI